jgi:hypothetical protein
MKSVVLKPIMWNTNGYIQPSGYPSSSGYSKDYGYGHEEWNNKPNRFWRGFKLFHTEATNKLLEYSSSGELGILMVASNEGNQYAIGIATSVYHNDEEERELIAEELNIYDEWNQIWSLDIVKSKFNNNQKNFLKHWKKNYEWIRWKCPKDQYFHFNQPLILDPQRISGKSRIISMHGRFQAVYPEQVISIIENYIPKRSPIISWLSEPDFDESLISDSLKNYKRNKKRCPKRKIKTGTNSPSERKFKYWIEGERSVEPHHADLQSKFVRFLKSSGIEYEENANFIDVQYHQNGKKYFSEIKPTVNVETKYAIRAAIGQLFEYQYNFDKNAILEIVIGNEPKKNEAEFVKSIGLCISYYDSKKKTFLKIEPNN